MAKPKPTPEPTIAVLETIPAQLPQRRTIRQFLVQDLGMQPEKVLGADASPLLGATKEFVLALCEEMGLEISAIEAQTDYAGGNWSYLQLVARVRTGRP